MTLAASLEAALPPVVRTLLRSGRAYWRGRRRARTVFSDIYEKNAWGGAQSELFSGIGSRGDPASAYVSAVRAFIETRGIKTAVDLGCGDFHIGSQIAEVCGSYTGVDVVPMVVERNAAKFTNGRITFACLDIIEDPLPQGELCLVRQVLQHLSNTQIRKVLRNISRYEQVIITEHYPPDGRIVARNIDKVQGADTRLTAGSAVYLADPPFSLRDLELLLEVQLPPGRDGETPVYETGVIRSYLWLPRGRDVTKVLGLRASMDEKS